jgi:hypothetical protein
MSILLTEGDISLSQCDAYLFTGVHDWPERFHIQPWFSSLTGWYHDSVETHEGWAPGRLMKKGPWEDPFEGSNKVVVYAHIGRPPNYEHLRICLVRLKENFTRLGIKSIAMPKVGSGSDLAWNVVKTFLVHTFAEENPLDGGVPPGLLVEVYQEDVPGKRAS